jgi:hypothetical protein
MVEDWRAESSMHRRTVMPAFDLGGALALVGPLTFDPAPRAMVVSFIAT